MPGRTTVSVDAIVVGAGPNGLSAAVALARAGHSVRVYEAAPAVGGGSSSAALTEPGFIHDVCAAVHALVLASPFLKALPLAQHGLEYVHPGVPFAHPLDDGRAAVGRRGVAETADGFGPRDARAYRELLEPFVDRADDLMDALLGPLGLRHPFLMARFGLHAIRSADSLANGYFESAPARAYMAGLAAHSMVPLDRAATAGYALGLVVGAHAVGWPVVRGGSQGFANAMASYLRSLGGEIVTDHRVESLDALPAARAVLMDVTPRQLIRIAGARMPSAYRERLERYRYGPGVFKMDWALSAPVPWRAPECHDAGTIHLGGTLAEIAHAEREVSEGRISEQPYVLAVQPSRFDPSRAPAGKHTLWAYSHVPNGSPVDMRQRIEDQIERFAPGFRDCVIARSALFPADMETRNPNLVGGDIAGGAADLGQLFARPVASLDPYRTAIPNVYICSSSTPPGVGVHGMCGYYAARSALRHSLG